MKKKNRYFASVLSFPFEEVYRIGVYRAAERLEDPTGSISRVLDLTFTDAAVCVEVCDFINAGFDASGEGARLREKFKSYAADLTTDLIKCLSDLPLRRFSRRFTERALDLRESGSDRPLIRFLKSSAKTAAEYRTKYSSGNGLCMNDPEYFIVY